MIYSLPKRQSEVLFYIMQGLSNADIAKKMKIKEPTVKMHLKALFLAKGVKSRLELVVHEHKKQQTEAALIMQRILRDIEFFHGSKYIKMDIENHFKKWGIK